jgi:hypothetical protein
VTGVNGNGSGEGKAEWAFLLREVVTPPGADGLLVTLRQRVYEVCEELGVRHGGSSVLLWSRFVDEIELERCRRAPEPFPSLWPAAQHVREARAERRPARGRNSDVY